MIKPTIGRVVWFWPVGLPIGSAFIYRGDGQPCAALISFVWSDRLVNLSVMDHNGNQHAFTSVILIQEGDEKPGAGDFCSWMPYQMGQAKREESKVMGDTVVSPPHGIGVAVTALKSGLRVRRAGWNGKGMWLSLTPGNNVRADLFWSPANRAFAEINGGSAEVLPYVTMKTADGKIVPWVCSQTDLLASDWETLV